MVVEVSVGGVGQLQGTEADVVQSLVVDREGLVGVLDQLVDGESGVVRLHDSVRYLGRRHDTVGVHDPVRKLLPDLGDEECSHPRASSSSQGVCELEALEAVASFRLLPHHVQHGVNQLSALSVVTLSPVIPGAALSEDEVVWPEDGSVWPRSDAVHCAGLQVHEHSSGNVLAARSLVVVHIDPFQLEVSSALIASGGIDAVLVRDNLPEFSPDLVAALAGLHVHDFTHIDGEIKKDLKDGRRVQGYQTRTEEWNVLDV